MNSGGRSRLMGFGCRAHDFGRLPADELAENVAAAGFRAVQLAPGKALPVGQFEPGRWSPEGARAAGEAFRARGVAIAVLGCYINPLAPSPLARDSEIGRFKEALRHCRLFGSAIVATETGSRNADCSEHPDNRTESAYRELLHSIAELAATAEEQGVVLGLEAVSRHVINSPRRMRRLLDDLASDAAGVVFDPVNLVESGSAEEQRRIVGEAYDLFGDRILVVHAKDFRLDAASPAGRGSAIRVVPPGRGLMDWTLVAERERSRKIQAPLLLEDLRPEDMEASRSFLRVLWEGERPEGR